MPDVTYVNVPEDPIGNPIVFGNGRARRMGAACKLIQK